MNKISELKNDVKNLQEFRHLFVNLIMLIEDKGLICEIFICHWLIDFQFLMVRQIRKYKYNSYPIDVLFWTCVSEIFQNQMKNRAMKKHVT